MLLVMAFIMTPDDMLITSPEYDEIQSIRDWRMWTGPGYVFLVAATIGFFGTLVGGFARIFGARWSRHVLILAAVATLISYRGYETYTDSYLMAGADAVWIFLMGWLAATPVPTVTPENRASIRKMSSGIAVAAISGFALQGWFLFSSWPDAVYAADVSIDIEVGSQTVEGAGEFQMRVGTFSTLRLDGYIVDMIILDASAQEADLELRVFRNVSGARGQMLTSCIDFTAPVGQVFGLGVSCGDVLIGMSGQFDPVD